MSEITHGDIVTSKFFKGTGRLRIREQELEQADVS